MLETLTMNKKQHSIQPAALRDIPFFALFSLEQLQEVLASSPVISFAAGQVVLKQGEPSDFIYLVLEGGVKVHREDSTGAVYMLGDFGTGKICGELTLLRGEPNRANITAFMDSTLLAINRATILNIIHAAEPEQVLNIFFVLEDQTRAASERGYKEIMSRRMLTLQAEVEKQRALTQMVAGVAHEVNTPLGVINAAVNIMARELATAPSELTALRASEIAESLELMRVSVERADHLLQGFKNVSVSQLSDEKDAFNIVEVLEETIGLIAVRLKQNQIQVKFENQLTADQKQWIGYRGSLSQVLINLLSNTERYAYPNGIGGTVEVTISVDADEDHYRLSVRDHGHGITAENQIRVFEPFFTTGRGIGGTGLGLSIVHSIVTKILQGQIRLKSEEKQGTEFIVIFPRKIS